MTATERLRERLLGQTPSPTARLWGWLGPLFLTVIGGIARFWDLGRPHQLVFDETYYVKQGMSMMEYGYERRVRTGLTDSGAADKYFTADTPNVWGNQPDMVVHPPVGKWMIGLGESLFGYTNSFGWRFSVALAGTLCILIVGRCAWYLFKSPVMATIAAFLMAFEGHEFVHSRTGLLDMFVGFFAILTFYLVLVDRERSREILARKVGAIIDGGGDVAKKLGSGPFLGFRPFIFLAGISGGLCAGTKWSGAFYVAMAGLLIVFWGVGARRASGIKRWFTGTALLDGVYAFFALVGTALVTYVASWAGWFASQTAYNRRWAEEHPGGGEPWMGADLNSLWMYHVEAMKFHVRLTSPHSWQSNPWSWMVQSRPTLFFAEYPTRGVDGCEYDSCAKMIHNVGSVSIWWMATAAILIMVFAWLLKRDWRAGAILAGWAAGYLPWFNYQQRTIFTFYAVAFGPFVVLMATYVVGMILGRRSSSPHRLAAGRLVAGCYLLVVLLNFIYFWPIWTAQIIPKEGTMGFASQNEATLTMFAFIMAPVLVLALGYVLHLKQSGWLDPGRGAAALPVHWVAGYAVTAALLLVAWGWSIMQVVHKVSWDSHVWWPSWS